MSSLPLSMDAEDFIKMMRDNMEILDCTQAEYAEMRGVSTAYLSDVLNGRREPGEKLLKAHGMKRVVYYEYDV